jgi:hypothetical protein
VVTSYMHDSAASVSNLTSSSSQQSSNLISYSICGASKEAELRSSPLVVRAKGGQTGESQYQALLCQCDKHWHWHWQWHWHWHRHRHRYKLRYRYWHWHTAHHSLLCRVLNWMHYFRFLIWFGGWFCFSDGVGARSGASKSTRHPVAPISF